MLGDIDQGEGGAGTGTGDGSMTMVYDASFDSWRQFGVISQPFWVLYDRTGKPIANRPGQVDFELVAPVL